MAHPEQAYVNGVSRHGQNHRPLDRPYTVDEAIPLTPFTSIIPIESEILPAPTIGSVSIAPSLMDLVSSEDFEALNQEASGQSQPSKRLQYTAAQLHTLLERGSKTEYYFKTGPKSSSTPSSRPPISMAANLTPLSKMIYDQTPVSYRMPTPDTPGYTPPGAVQAAVVKGPPTSRQTPQVKPNQTPRQMNKEAHRQNSSRVEVTLPTPSQLDAAEASFAVASGVQTAGRKAPSSYKLQLPASTGQPARTGLASPASLPTYSEQEFVPVTSDIAKQPSPGDAPRRTSQTGCGSARRSEEIAPASAKQGSIGSESRSVSQTPAPPKQVLEPVLPSGSQSPAASKRLGSETVPPSGSQRSMIAIELRNPATFNKCEYAVIAEEPDDPDEPTNLSSRKRERGQMDGEEVYSTDLDVRQRAQLALQDLTRFIRTIQQSEDEANNRRSGNEVVSLTMDNETILTAQAQHRIQGLIAKAISLNCFQSVPLEDLLHIAQLSGTALKATENIGIRISLSWGQAEVDQWINELPQLEAAMKAARTALRIMCGGRDERQLYSEDIIERSFDLFKSVLDGIIIPLAELRLSDKTTSALSRSFSPHKKRISSVLVDFQKLFSEMAAVISKVDVSSTVSNTLEFTATQVLFVETAHAEKDSVIETQKFDGLRLVAMDTVTQIFLMNPSQRQGIINDILTSLEKLPLAKQRARQFKLVDGTNIQPVSALIMRLIQASAGKYDDSKELSRARALQSLEGDDENAQTKAAGKSRSTFNIRNEEQAAANVDDALAELQGVVNPLNEAVRSNALFVMRFLVQRAMNSTKTGENPWRNLLDLFVEDFTSCLDNPDWPAAELLVRELMILMKKLVDDKEKKTSAPAKNMALEVLGVIGAAISNLRGYVRKTTNALYTVERDELTKFLCEVAAAALELRSRAEHLVSWSGPYRATLQHLENRFSQDPHLTSANSFLVTSWAIKLYLSWDACDDEAPERDQEFGRLAYRLREMIQDRHWLEKEYDFKTVSPTQGKLSYAITLLRSPLCEYYSHILSILIGSMASDQATVRSKSLKSINQVLETDPSILSGDSVGIIGRILECSNDSSTQVRDSALGLMGKCINLRPALEEQMVMTVIDRFVDAGPGVRKRAMKLAKDIYLRNHDRTVRSAIANGLLIRMQDPEESVRELARQMIEEIWFAPFYNGESTAVSQISVADHVALMVQTVKQGSLQTTMVLDKVFQSLLGPESKTAQVNWGVCKRLVASMFELVGTPDSSDPNVPSWRDVLQVLTIFAKAEGNLFTFEQIRILQPHVQSLTTIRTNEELAAGKAVVVIYRRVLPQLSTAHKEFLQEIRKQLSQPLQSAARTLVDDLMACLWTISNLLDTSENLAKLLLSCLTNISMFRQALQKGKELDTRQIKQFIRYSLIVGMLGKHCDLESHIDLFKTKFKFWTGSSVSKLMVDMVVPFGAPNQPEEVRKAALDAVGLICQSNPRNYVSVNVYHAFEEVFESRDKALEAMILRSFKEFLVVEEKRSEQKPEETQALGAQPQKKEKKRELTVMGGTNYDDVASATTARFLNHITRIALSSQDDHAFLSVEVLASINRQGLTHPKETGVTFITLETSPNRLISELAYSQHKLLHEKHETVVEREYPKGFQSAFLYQRDVVGDPHGATTDPFTSKLHLMMEALKISRSKNRQKFLEKICGQVEFEPSTLEVIEEIPQHVQYSCFIIENLAFFEYITIGELQAVITTMEKIFTNIGVSLAQPIEAEILQITMEAIENTTAPDPNTQMANWVDDPIATPNTAPTVDIQRLRQLASGSMILLSLWEARTHLRRSYGMNSTRREGKGKAPAKDLAKAPVKVQGVTGDKFWEDVTSIMNSLSSREQMVKVCSDFVELMNVDKERKISENDDEEGEDDDPATPSGDEDGGDAPASGGPGRGRKRKASSNTPCGRKKRARSTSQPRKRGRPRKVVDVEMADADGDFDDEF